MLAGGLIAIAIVILGGMIAFGTENPPPKLASMNDPLEKIDFSDLPPLETVSARRGSPIAFRPLAVGWRAWPCRHLGPWISRLQHKPSSTRQGNRLQEHRRLCARYSRPRQDRAQGRYRLRPTARRRPRRLRRQGQDNATKLTACAGRLFRWRGLCLACLRFTSRTVICGGLC